MPVLLGWIYCVVVVVVSSSSSSLLALSSPCCRRRYRQRRRPLVVVLMRARVQGREGFDTVRGLLSGKVHEDGFGAG